MIKNIKSIIASAILISLTACGTSAPPSDQVIAPTSTPETTSPAPVDTTQTTASTEGIIFKDPVKDRTNGFIDSLNNATTETQTIEPTKVIQLSGWAIAPEQNQPADSVIITYGDNNTVVSTIPVGINRPDVAKALKNPGLEKSGWVAQIDPASLNLGQEKAKIKAWSYNSQTKEAYPLNNSFFIVRK